MITLHLADKSAVPEYFDRIPQSAFVYETHGPERPDGDHLMMTKYWPETLVLVIESALWLLAMVAYLPAMIFTLVIYLVLRLTILRNDLDREVTKTSAVLSNFLQDKSTVGVLTPDDFYSKLAQAVAGAKGLVAISYLHTKPPSHRAGSVGARYYAELSRQIKHQLFRYWRVETVTPEKLAWLEKLIDEYRGNQKASLACMLPDKVGNPVPEVSVQIIDDHCCPVKSRIESIGWGHRGIRLGSRMAGVPVKGAFFRIA